MSIAFAAKGGHKEIVQMMLDFGANNYNTAIAQMIRNYAKK
jgi:hypothetical protein